MQFYDTPRLTYDSGARYDDVIAPPQPKNKHMWDYALDKC